MFVRFLLLGDRGERGYKGEKGDRGDGGERTGKSGDFRTQPKKSPEKQVFLPYLDNGVHGKIKAKALLCLVNGCSRCLR